MIYDYTITTGKGEQLDLASYKGKDKTVQTGQCA